MICYLYAITLLFFFKQGNFIIYFMIYYLHLHFANTLSPQLVIVIYYLGYCIIIFYSCIIYAAPVSFCFLIHSSWL